MSLGAFGGYLTVGFDHSVASLAVAGNQFTGSSEPGVVWVMQDVNGNGKPDDQWYRLKGSEYGNKSVYEDYQVTYYKPSADGADVAWKDNKGNSGKVPYMGQYHTQPSYFPAWVTEDAYTLSGVRLPARVSQDKQTGQWVFDSYAWGYVDNCGQDTQNRKTSFKLGNAIGPDGKEVYVQYVDFVKVQSAVQATAGWTGEVSTDVTGFYDQALE